MTNVFSKICVLCTIVSMAVSANLKATGCCPEAPQPYCKSPCCPPTCNPSPYCGPNCIPAPYCQEFSVYGEVLFWVPELIGLEAAFGSTAIHTTTSASGVLTTTITESDRAPQWQWKPGFRVGADYAFLCFDLAVDWTHYRGKATFRDGDSKGNWRIKYDVVDALFSRLFCIAPCFMFRPFIGLSGLKIDQSLHTDLVTQFSTVLVTNPTFSHRRDSENFWGIGPEIGVEADWYIGCGFNVYGSFDFVTYYGKVTAKNFDTDTFPSTVSVLHGKRRHPFNDIATDLAFGLRWDKSWQFCNYDLLAMLKLGVEQHRIYDFSNLGSDGTLSIDGGVFAAGLGIRY